MGTIHNYVPGQFSQVNLEDGSKILVSIAAAEVKVFLLGFFGFPKKTLHTFPGLSVSNIRTVYGDDVLNFLTHLIAALPNAIVVAEQCQSLDRLSGMQADAKGEI